MPERAPFASPRHLPAPQFSPAVSDSPGVRKFLRGDLDTFSLPDLLQWIEFGRQSGRLLLTHGAVHRSIDVKDGEIVFVSSTRSVERLGAYLVRTGTLSASAAYASLAENLLSGRNLTRVILDRSFATRENLARSVEGLAIEILLDSFRWKGATFEFDPEVPTEDILQIHLSLRGQILALYGAKSVDEHPAAPPGPEDEGPAGAGCDPALLPEAAAGTFWTILERTSPAEPPAAALRDLFREFLQFVADLRRRLTGPLRFAPIYDDTAVLLRRALAQGSPEEQLIQVSALDPFLTLNLVSFANSLSPTPAPVVSVRTAAGTIGPEAFRLFLDLTSRRDAPRASSAGPLERVVRSSSISTAVAAALVARRLGQDEEEAYAAGLLAPLAAYELLQALLDVGLEPGNFRAGVLREYRSLCGAQLARRWSLPGDLAALLGTDGSVTAGSPGTVRLVYFASQLVSLEGIGCELTSEDPELVEPAVILASDPELVSEIRRDTEQLFDIIGLR